MSVLRSTVLEVPSSERDEPALPVRLVDPEPSSSRFLVRAFDDRPLVLVAGEVDAAAVDELRATLWAAHRRWPHGTLHVDLGRATLLTAAGVDVLVTVGGALPSGLRIVGARGIVARVLSICDVACSDAA
jgi:anti-anti-sigma regulatory factor